jgi:hypothetical protein
VVNAEILIEALYIVVAKGRFAYSSGGADFSGIFIKNG